MKGKSGFDVGFQKLLFGSDGGEKVISMRRDPTEPLELVSINARAPAVPLLTWREQHSHHTYGQLYYRTETCLKISMKHVAWILTVHCCLNKLPASNPNDTFGLICKAYTVIHLWCQGGKKRFMAHNKLLRSCMWWGNQGGKWGGNSLLHATLIHPSVRETSPLCTPHLKRP